MAADPPITISAQSIGAWTVVTVDGEIDMATADRLEAVLVSAAGWVALDLSQVRFIDSTGLHVLVRGQEAQERLVLVAPSGVVRRLLQLTGLTPMFEICEELDIAEPSA